MKPSEITVHQIDVQLIKVFISRTRRRAPFDRMRDAISETGMVPIQVRSIDDWPAKDRRRPDGGLYRYELIVGEGRLMAAKELGWKRVPAFIINAPEEEIATRFLAENMIRKPLPWAQQARLVKKDLDSGTPVEVIADRYKVTAHHVVKYRRILSKTATGLEEEVAAMPMNEAEVLTALPAEDQTLVVSALRDVGALEGNIAAAVAKARAIREETGSLSLSDLRKSLTATETELQKVTKKLNVKRLHASLGPGNLSTLLARPEFRQALAAARVSVERFESLV